MRKGIRLLMFFMVLAVLIYVAYGVYSWKDTSGDYLSSTKQLYHTPENTIDVVFAGSSHCYCTMYPALLWERSGIASFDMAVSGQDKASTYHMLVELCKTQNPKVVWVDLYGLLLDAQGIEGNTYRNMLAMRTSKNSVELIREYVEPENQLDFFLKWPIVHTRFWEIGKYDYVEYEPSLYGRGAVYQWGQNESGKEAPRTTKLGELSDKNVAWLERLRDLGKKENFDLVFFVAPFDVLAEEQEQINAAGQFAKENDIPFFDFNQMAEEISLDYQEDFLERFHLNAVGAEKITEFARQYLLDNYELTDRRGDPKYVDWEKDLTWYRHLEFLGNLGGVEDLGEYAKALTTMDELCVIVDVEKVTEDFSEEELQILESIGFSRQEAMEGGTWILKGGEKKKVLSADRTEDKEYVEDLNEYDSLRVRRKGERMASDVMINYDECLRPGCNVNVIAYDLFLKQEIPSLGF